MMHNTEDFWAGYLVYWKASEFLMSFILYDAAFTCCGPNHVWKVTDKEEY